MDTPVPPVDDLLQRARQGDGEAQAELLRTYRQRLVRIVASRMDRRMQARVDPSDIVQNALADAHIQFDEYLRSEPLPFFVWLRKLAWNHLIDLYREHVVAQKRSVLRESIRPALSEDAALELSQALAASQTTPSEAVSRLEMRQKVLSLLDQLSDNDREILTLRYLEGLSVEESALVLGISESAAKVRHFRAVERVRLALQSREGDAHA